jgi:DNA polymerase-1
MTVITLDLETTSLDPHSGSILLEGYRENGGEVTQRTWDGTIDKKLHSLLKVPENVLRGANIKFDALFLARNGYTINCQLEDTRVLAYLNWPEATSHSLKALVRERLHFEPTELSDIQFKPTKKDLEYLDKSEYFLFADGKYCRRDLLIEYHRADIINVDRLHSILRITDWFKEVEMPLTRMLFEMELYGCPLDTKQLDDLQRVYIESAANLLDRLIESVMSVGFVNDNEEAFNPNSSDQIQEVLKKRGYKLEEICDKTAKGAWCTDKALLKTLSHKGDEFCKILLEYRRYSKILSTYVEPFILGAKRDGRLHGSINQAGSEDLYGDGAKGTNTGRLSSSNPNLQNIPSRTKEGKEVRKAFIASPGAFLFDSDLSQIEPRLVAHYSQAPKLIHAYANNIDTHGLFANDIFGKVCGKDSIERFIGKSSWLATVYGCSYKKLLYICEGFSDNVLELDTEQYADCFHRLKDKEQKKIKSDLGKDYLKIYEQWMFFKNVQDVFTAKNPEIFDWRQNHIDRTRRLGYVITIGGRRIDIQGLDSKDWGIRFSAERRAVNFLIQGSAADVIKSIMIRTQNEIVRPKKGRIFSVVHDELLGELFDPNDFALVKDVMENTCKLRNVGIKADGKLISNWSQK